MAGRPLLRVVFVGPQNVDEGVLVAFLRRFRSFSVSFDHVNAVVPVDADDSFFFDIEGQVTPNCFNIYVTSIQIEDNWFSRPSPDASSFLMTSFQSEIALQVRGWSRERFLALTALKGWYTCRFLRAGGKYMRLFTVGNERSVYNFSTDKMQAANGMKYLEIGSRAREVLAGSGLSERELDLFKSDLLRLKLSFFERLNLLFSENALIAMGVSFLIGWAFERFFDSIVMFFGKIWN